MKDLPAVPKHLVEDIGFIQGLRTNPGISWTLRHTTGRVRTRSPSATTKKMSHLALQLRPEGLEDPSVGATSSLREIPWQVLGQTLAEE